MEQSISLQEYFTYPSKIYHISKKVINLYISHTLNQQLRNLNRFLRGNCLFESVKLAKNADLDEYRYSGFSIGFDSRSEFSFTDGSIRKNVITFGADINSSVHIEKGKNILILGEGPTQRLDDLIAH